MNADPKTLSRLLEIHAALLDAYLWQNTGERVAFYVVAADLRAPGNVVTASNLGDLPVADYREKFVEHLRASPVCFVSSRALVR